jgi:Glycosyl transferase family 2.
MNQSVCVVIVTYGNRWSLLQRVLFSTSNLEQVKRIVVVDNNSDYDLKNFISESNFSKVDLISLPENFGSAYGYKIGIERAITMEDCDYIWLLDDDNNPLDNALDELLKNYYQLLEKYRENEFALLSLREDRLDYRESAIVGNSSRFFPIKDSVFGFHIKQLPIKIIRKLYKKIMKFSTTNNYIFQPILIPYAPYGGFFFHKGIIDSIGLPNEKFFLYSDDHDFTYRITKNGGKIFLIPSSKIKDIDTSWHMKKQLIFFKMLLFSDSSFRVYYAVRNRIYFEINDMMHNKFIYLINLFIFRSILKVFSLVYGKNDRYMLINKAIYDAKRGVLGKVENIDI